jgi:cytochrome b subunit of formate dehydrogenase
MRLYQKIMIAQVSLAIGLLLFLTSGILWILNIGTELFTSYAILTVISSIAGLIFGCIAVLFTRSISRKLQVIPNKRHTPFAFLEHWGTAAGIFVLVISGYSLKTNPTYLIANFHFFGLVMTMFFGCCFLVDFIWMQKYWYLLPDKVDIVDGTIKKYLLGTKQVDSGKYHASQRSAFLAFTILGSEILVTGIIKTISLNITINSGLLYVSTLIHDVSGLLLTLLVIIHIILVFANKSNFRLLINWFTGNETK